MNHNAGRLMLCCNENNDLYKVLKGNGYSININSDLPSLVKEAENNTGILVLSDYYPKQTIIIDKDLMNMVKSKDLRLYIEYPLSVNGFNFAEPNLTEYERIIVSSDFYGNELEKDSIMMLNGGWYIPVEGTDIPNDNIHLCMAKAAGYDKLVFSLPDNSFPILFQKSENFLIACSCLSNFVTGRYSPYLCWKKLWESILKWVFGNKYYFNLNWEPIVGPTYKSDDIIPDGFERMSLERSFDWFGQYVIIGNSSKKGAIEGFMSGIDHKGRQMMRNIIRGDCVSESAMVLALDWHLNKRPDKKHLSKEVLNYLWSPSFFQNNPDSSMYGLSNWNENCPIFYGDDNARVILSSLIARNAIDEDVWDEKILKCLLANLRTSDKQGFRYNFLREESFIPNGRDWTYYMNDEEPKAISPHFQAYLWAAFLWAYSLTGYKDFLTKSENAIRITMEAYPGKWKWTNSLTAEISRMILPLAFLIKVDNTPEHREWLNIITRDLIKNIDKCGAVKDMLGDVKMGRYPPPQSNEDYGTTEASLIQKNGDPATDLLYTANWALLGLHEAGLITGDKNYIQVENRLAEFLCRIQVKSKAHDYLDGAWMRSFDFEKWEYWGSSADIGWGAWCVESGWVNSWIACILSMRQNNESIFNLSGKEHFRSITPTLVEEMGMAIK